MQITEHVLFNDLFDIYGSLLTERQYHAVQLHVRDDLSLSETAEELGITKQAVSDALTTARTKLDDYESKLHMLQISAEIEKLVYILKQQENISRDLYIQADRLIAMIKGSEEE